MRKIVASILGTLAGYILFAGLILGAAALVWWVNNDFSFYKTIRY